MPDIEPEEVGGLQDLVSALESVFKTHPLTNSVSFRVFSPQVMPSLHIRLLPLCLKLDYYLVKKPNGKYPLEFDLEKFKTPFIYAVLKDIKDSCLYMAKNDWYYKFLNENSNIADTEIAIKEGLRLRRK
jgi:hypothetical protein